MPEVTLLVLDLVDTADRTVRWTMDTGSRARI
jgi:hypothetical protein